MGTYIPNAIDALVIEPTASDAGNMGDYALLGQPIVGWYVDRYGKGSPIGTPVTVTEIDSPYAIYFPVSKEWGIPDGSTGNGLRALAEHFQPENSQDEDGSDT